jgi:hypothetical protein
MAISPAVGYRPKVGFGTTGIVDTPRSPQRGNQLSPWESHHDARLRLEQVLLFCAGGILLASGFFHVLVWLVDGGSLSGSVSWRKPILFGVSAGVTLLSIGWLVGKLRRRAGDFWLLSAFGVAMLVEVGLITLQQWRGVPSHFNRSTPFDANVLLLIESLIVFVTIVIAYLTWRCFRPLATQTDMTLAIRGGMALLLFSCLLGFVLVAHGNHQVTLGQPPEVFGAAGVMKFPHGTPMHAIQFLPFLAWVLRKLRVEQRKCFLAVAGALTSVSSFTAYSLLQTFTGRARFDLWWLSAVLLVASAIFLSGPACLGVRQAVRRLWRA